MDSTEEMKNSKNEKTQQKKSPVRVIISVALICALAFGGFYGYEYFVPVKITPQPEAVLLNGSYVDYEWKDSKTFASRHDRLENISFVLGRDDSLNIANAITVESDVDHGKVDMPDTKTVLGMTFPARYDIQEFIYTVDFSIDDETVARIEDSENGKVIKATGKGCTNLNITCGELSYTVLVSVYGYIFPEEPQPESEMLVGDETTAIEIGEYDILNADFASSDETVAKVDETGKVTRLSKGSTEITITTPSVNVEPESIARNTYTTTVIVHQPVTGIQLRDISVYRGCTSTLKYSWLPSNADYGTDESVTYFSSDESVAKVDSNGRITGISVGTATVTVKSLTNGFTDTAKITVNAPASTSAPTAPVSTPAPTPAPSAPTPENPWGSDSSMAGITSDDELE